MNMVKLAPFKGLKADNTQVELESLSSIIGNHPFIHSQVQNYKTSTNQSLPIQENLPLTTTVNTLASETTDADTNKRSASFKKNIRYRRCCTSHLNIKDINNLWSVYLRQQQELGGKHFLERVSQTMCIKMQILFF